MEGGTDDEAGSSSGEENFRGAAALWRSKIVDQEAHASGGRDGDGGGSGSGS